MVNAQKWLESQEEYNTKEKRAEIKELDISKKELVGELDLNEFINLEKLNCSSNQLTSINLGNCKKLWAIDCGYNKLNGLDLTGLNNLEEVGCYNNYLKTFDYSSLSPEKLTYLNITANNLPKQDLTVFSKFTNLETLWIGNSDEDIQEGFSVNQFYGSLESLKNLTKLKSLEINNTDIDSGLEYLPESIEEIHCSSKERSESKVKAIKEQLSKSNSFISVNSKYLRFTSELQEEWENKGFNYEQVKEWANSLGDYFEVSDYNFCAWLRDEKELTAETLNYDELDNLIEEYKEEKSSEEEDNEIYNSVQEYINKEYSDKENTKQIKFNSNTLQLSEKGTLVISDYPELESIIALGENNTKNITQVTISNCPQLKEINITNFVDNEQLEIKDCPNLEILYCGNNKLSELKGLNECLKLTELKCWGNQLTNLEISNCANLKTLGCNTNQLTNLDLSKLKKLEYLGCWNNQLKELNLSENKELNDLGCNDNQLTNLNLHNPNLTVFKCWNNQLTNLDLTNCKKITELWCNQNQLTQLTLTKLDNLEKLYCWENNLTNLDFLNNCNSEKLAILSLDDNNFPPQDLTIFSQFKELKELRIAGVSKPSYFTGSCQPLQELKKLEHLDIRGTDITHGLEYLSDNVKNVYCSTYRPDAKVIDIYEELQPFGEDITKWRKVKLEKKLDLVISPLLPPQLIGENNQKNKFARLVKQVQRQNRENKLLANISKINYDKIHFENWPRRNKSEIPSFEQLPTRLYNIKEKKVEETKNNSDIKSYAILSYVWGDPKIKATPEMEKEEWWKNNLTVSGNKSLRKAIQNCNLLGINHIWIDQLCIIQTGDEAVKDKENEIPKMRQYYSNAEVTLVALNDEVGDTSNIDLIDILRKVVDSEWFERSWTFQEGWLSKHTIFMFDDKLVDGRAVAGIWALNQLGYIGEGRYNSRSEFDRGTKKIATPVGWTYYRNGYNENDKVELTLTQALYAIKNRKRFWPIDGIYSLLGLLPYGSEVEVSYSKNPEQALKEVMLIAVKHGYAEPLSWLGISNPKNGLCWIPKIDKNGSTSVMGSVGRVNSIWRPTVGTVTLKDTDLISLTNQGLDFAWIMPHYLIQKDKPETIHKLESGFEIEGGLYRKEVIVKPRDMEEEIKVSLLGTQESLTQTQAGNILIVLYKEWFGTNKLLALLVKESEQMYDEDEEKTMHIYHRLGLVELVDNEGIKFTSGVANFKKKTILGSEYQAQIEIPPKK